MRALETATVAAKAARGAADAAQRSGRPSGPPEPASVPNVRFGQSTTRIHPIKKSHDEALKYFEKQALLHERNVQKLVRTQKEIDRLHVCGQCDGTKQTQRAEIHLPTWYISVQGAFGRCGDERGLAGVIGERLCFIIHDSERHELEKRDEHQPSREQHLHPKSDTTGSDCSSGLRQKHHPRNRFSSSRARASSSNSKNGQTSAWRTWTAKELTRKQRNTMHWKSIGK